MLATRVCQTFAGTPSTARRPSRGAGWGTSGRVELQRLEPVDTSSLAARLFASLRAIAPTLSARADLRDHQHGPARLYFSRTTFRMNHLATSTTTPPGRDIRKWTWAETRRRADGKRRRRRSDGGVARKG